MSTSASSNTSCDQVASDPLSASAVVFGSSALESARMQVRTGLDASWDLLERQADGAPGELAGRLRSLFGKQGKRVRSTLLLLVSRLGERPDERIALHSAAAIELLHLASLAHDDVIDDSDLRRGEASAPSRWGNQMAVLVGDYAFARSMRLAIDTNSTSIVDAINTASCMLTAGEVAELDLSRSEHPTIESYREVIHLKTASLLETCCQCGAIAGGLSDSEAAAAGRFGRRFGMAFQMCDDLLDLGAVPDLDKPTRADLANGLVNLPALLVRELVGEDLRILADLDTPALLAHLRANGVLQKASEFVESELSYASIELATLPDRPARKHLAAVLADLSLRLHEAVGG